MSFCSVSLVNMHGTEDGAPIFHTPNSVRFIKFLWLHNVVAAMQLDNRNLVIALVATPFGRLNDTASDGIRTSCRNLNPSGTFGMLQQIVYLASISALFCWHMQRCTLFAHSRLQRFSSN